MSEQPHNSHAPAPASEDLGKRLKAASDDPASKGLVERLKEAANDALLLHAIVESNDSVSLTAAFATLLAGGTASAANGSELRKKARNRPCRSLPAEAFLEVVLFADRDTLDAMQLICSFLLNFIRERELTQLALRAISRVRIGDVELTRDLDECWLPIIEIEYNRSPGKELAPKTVHQLASCLRTAFCELVCINVDERNFPFSDVCGMVFDDLVAPSTSVGTLNISLPRCEVKLALRGIVAFNSVKTVNVDSPKTYTVGKPLDESFFVPAAERGVRHIDNRKHNGRASVRSPDIPTNTAAALSFGFSDPTAGGSRSLLGFDCDIGADFLALVKQKASELREARRVDFIFEIDSDVPAHIDSTGFEQYQRDDGRTWLMDDLDNHINVEVKQTENLLYVNLVEIHVFSRLSNFSSV